MASLCPCPWTRYDSNYHDDENGRDGSHGDDNDDHAFGNVGDGNVHQATAHVAFGLSRAAFVKGL